MIRARVIQAMQPGGGDFRPAVVIKWLVLLRALRRAQQSHCPCGLTARNFGERPVSASFAVSDAHSNCPKRTAWCQLLDAPSSDSGKRSHKLLRTDNGARVVRDVDLESGMHVLRGVTGCRVFHHRDLVSELSGKAYGGLHARMRYKAYHNELMHTMRLELQIQIGVGKAAGAPMLKR